MINCQNIDEAFLRRIHVIVEFPFPDAEARLRILCGLFPPGLERADYAELEALAERFKLPGGSLKNVVLDAAFRALGDAKGATAKVSELHLVAAIARSEGRRLISHELVHVVQEGSAGAGVAPSNYVQRSPLSESVAHAWQTSGRQGLIDRLRQLRGEPDALDADVVEFIQGSLQGEDREQALSPLVETMLGPGAPAARTWYA